MGWNDDNNNQEKRALIKSLEYWVYRLKDQDDHSKRGQRYINNKINNYKVSVIEQDKQGYKGHSHYSPDVQYKQSKFYKYKK